MFYKVTGKYCIREGCPEKNVIKEASAFQCELCTSVLEPKKVRNHAAVLAAAVAGMLLTGGAGLVARSYVLSKGAEVIGNITPPGVKPTTPGSALAFQFAVQEEGDGRPRNVPGDHIFRSGDRLRFLMKGASNTYYYVFYEDRKNDKIEVLFPDANPSPSRDAEAIAVPGGNNNWLRLDKNAGNERFLLMASATPIEEFDFGGPDCSRSRFDAALEKVRSKYGVVEGKSAADLDWNRIEATGKGITLAKFAIQHQQ